MCKGDPDIGLQSSRLLPGEFMGDFRVKPDPAQHTGKLSVDRKPVDSGSLARKNNIQRFGRVFRDLCGEGKSIAGPHGNNTDPHRRPLQGSRYGVYRSISSADHDIRDLFFLQDRDQKIVSAFRVGRQDTEIDFLSFSPTDDQILQGRLTSRTGNGIYEINDFSWHAPANIFYLSATGDKCNISVIK